MANKNIIMQEFNGTGYDILYPQIIPSFNQDVNLNSNRVINVATPLNNTDAVNKQYVDEKNIISQEIIPVAGYLGHGCIIENNLFLVAGKYFSGSSTSHYDIVCAQLNGNPLNLTTKKRVGVCYVEGNNRHLYHIYANYANEITKIRIDEALNNYDYALFVCC